MVTMVNLLIQKSKLESVLLKILKDSVRFKPPSSIPASGGNRQLL